MGKRIRVQRRGRGSPTFRAAIHKRIAGVCYPPLSTAQTESSVKGTIRNIFHEPGRGAPIGLIRLADGKMFYTVLPEGVAVGEELTLGATAPIEIGNVLPIGQIPAGTLVCNVELKPGDGGKVARSSGTYATVVAHTDKDTIIRFPSDRKLSLSNLCRATVGVISGGGRTDRPFVKAGKKAMWMVAKGHKYPRTRGVAMIAAAHPFGGGRHQTSVRPTSVSRGAPPGAKVGLIAPKRSGRGKRRRKGTK